MTVGRDGEHVTWAGWRDPANQDVDLPALRFDAAMVVLVGSLRC